MNLPNARMELLMRSPLWAILPDRYADIVASFLTGEAWAGSWEAAKPSTESRGRHKIAIIPVQGVLTKDGPRWLGNSYESIAEAAEKAAADPDVKRVVLSVDSPGGEVTGLPETAAVLGQLAKAKPLHAMVDGMAASAAYWLTSQASSITLTPSGEVGSVGVRMAHVDISKMLEDSGYKVTELYSGNFKTEWSPFKPVSDEAKADMQTRLDAAHTDFINAIQAGRGDRVSTEMKGQRMGEGRMFGADAAAEHGLVDKVQTGRQFYKEIQPAEEAPGAPVHFGFQKARIDIEKARL